MAPTQDLLHHAEAAEQLAAWIGGSDRARLLDIASDLRRRAAARERLWFWLPSPATAPRQVIGLRADESWQDPERVRFSLMTTTGPAAFEAPRALLPQLMSQFSRLGDGEPPHCIVLEAAHWRFLRGRGGAMALQVQLKEGGAICLPIARRQAAKLLSWLDLALGGLRLRRRRLEARGSPPAPPIRRPIRFHLVQGEPG
jgi:hypothetical protein